MLHDNPILVLYLHNKNDITNEEEKMWKDTYPNTSTKRDSDAICWGSRKMNPFSNVVDLNINKMRGTYTEAIGKTRVAANEWSICMNT